MKCENIKKNRGFVLLFAVTLAALLLSIALGVSSVALKEVKFSTSAKDTGNAFFAADTGAEQALYNDKSTVNLYGSAPGTWNFIISGLGIDGKGCAKVNVTKDSPNPPNIRTTIISNGYNTGSAGAGICTPPSNAVERELQTTYGVGSSFAVQNVVWVNTRNVSVSANNLTNVGSGIPSWDAGASSAQSITSGDGYVEFSINDVIAGKMGGLNNGDPDQNYTSIDYAIQCTSTGVLNLWENGVQVGSSLSNCIVNNDVFRVSIESPVVKYYKNGILLYTSLNAPTYPLIFDTSFNQTGGTITNAKILP
jgi:hypothetical protein